MRYLVVGQDYHSFALNLSQFARVEYIKFVDSYRDTLDNSRIYLAFDAIGAGTKNRTLQALARGIRVVGTKYSFENIFGERELRHEYSTFHTLEETLLTAFYGNQTNVCNVLPLVHSEEKFITALKEIEESLLK